MSAKQESGLNRISIVLASWCPHCVPLSLEMSKKMAGELKVPLRVLDIDHNIDGRTADDLVREHGDYCDDYIVPQVFLEFYDGTVSHIFTGFSEATEVTKKRWDDLFQSEMYSLLRPA